MFHILHTDIPAPQRLNCPFYYQPHPLCIIAKDAVMADVEARKEWEEEVSAGKMFGVLIVRDAQGRLGFLKAFSGQLCGKENVDGWVPAIFDYLQHDGYFVTHEREISVLNHKITELERSPLLMLACSRLGRAEAEGKARIDSYHSFVIEQKEQRARRRADGEAEAILIRESQFQKAELKRLKQQVAASIAPYKEAVENLQAEIAALKKKRKQMSDSLQQWLFSNFVMQNAKGDRMSVSDIFAKQKMHIPPSGTGECCAPKLLQYAFLHGMVPLAIAEFWMGRSPVGEIRRHGDFYPACQGKCRPLLDFMLQGIDVEPNALEADEKTLTLKIVYDDADIIIIDKPAGMLSVPGKANRLSAAEILEKQTDMPLFAVHRLDMQTSGLLMFAKSERIQRLVQRMFAQCEIKKKYVALLETMPADGIPTEGEISLPIAPDFINRPRQMVDRDNGKPSRTRYIIKGTRKGRALVELFPMTGRTHQLRVHCAHEDGLGVPIVGDDLYGTHSQRLMLHAEQMTFRHPVTGILTTVTSECDSIG